LTTSRGHRSSGIFGHSSACPTAGRTSFGLRHKPVGACSKATGMQGVPECLPGLREEGKWGASLLKREHRLQPQRRVEVLRSCGGNRPSQTLKSASDDQRRQSYQAKIGRYLSQSRYPALGGFFSPIAAREPRQVVRFSRWAGGRSADVRAEGCQLTGFPEERPHGIVHAMPGCTSLPKAPLVGVTYSPNLGHRAGSIREA
jgi:hypothetical protein